MEWRGNKRLLREITEHYGCHPEAEHWHDSEPHHLFMIDLVTATDSEEEATLSAERLGVAEHEDLVIMDIGRAESSIMTKGSSWSWF